MTNPGIDSLTGLPNRAPFNGALTRELASGQGFAVLLCDMDEMKVFNIWLGYQHGDALLIKVADALQSVNEVGLAARYGGDEFAALARCARGDIENTAGAVWRAMTAATALFDSHLLRQHAAEIKGPIRAAALRDGRLPDGWIPRYPLGVSLAAI